MAIRTKIVTGGNGINYTKEVDNQSDWGAIAFDTYFKDLSDGLIYWKDTTGLVIAIYEIAGLTGDTNTYTTGSTLIGSTVYFDRTDTLSAYQVDLSPLTGDTNYYTTGTTVAGSKLYFDRNDTLSAYTADLYYTTGTTVVGDIAYFHRTDSLSAYTLNLPSSSCVQTTYTGLTAMIATSGLTEGTSYCFPYQTIHNIENNAVTNIYNSQIDSSIDLSAQTFTSSSTHDEGDGIKTTFSAEVETLIVIAVSTSEINVEAYSQEYPNDVIYYDHSMSLTEDETVLRPGFITFRHDTVNDVSAHFDWRNVLHRRYDMDQAANRETEFRDWVHYDASTVASFPGAFYSEVIPIVVPFIDGNDDTFLGGIFTAASGATYFRDYKTIPYYNLDSTFLHQDIHIGKTNVLVSKLSGSGVGGNLKTGQFSGTTVGNVVLFGKSITNVKIGTDPSGVHISAALVKNIKIGNEVQNLNVGAQKKYDLTGLTFNYLQDIKIGDMSRDVYIGVNNRNTEIGNGNVGVFVGTDTTAPQSWVKVGNENSQIYCSESSHIEIGDANHEVFMDQCFSLKVGSGNEDVRVKYMIWEGTRTYISVTQLITPGFEEPNPNLIFPRLTGVSGPQAVIGDGNTLIYLSNIYSLNLGSRCTEITAFDSRNLRIGNWCSKIDLTITSDITIGDYSVNSEATYSKNINFGDYNTRCRILNTDTVNIGDKCSDIFMVNMGIGGIGDVNIGNTCQNIFARDSIFGGFNVGDDCYNITARGVSKINIGNESEDIYLESCFGTVIGNNSNKIAMSPLGMRYMFYYPTDGQYRFSDASPGYINPYSPQSNKYTEAGIAFLGAPNGLLTGTIPASFPTAVDTTPSATTQTYNIIGDNCNDIYIVGSTGTTIENNCSNISIGTHQEWDTFNVSISYSGTGATLGWRPLDEAYVIANATFDGKLANNNTFEDLCTDIRVIGPRGAGVGTPKVYDYEGNNFGENVTGIYTDAATPYSLTDTAIMLRRRDDSTRVDLSPITPLTASYASKVFDRRSPDGELWEQSINNMGTLQSPTKLA